MLKIELLYDPDIPFLVKNLEESKTVITETLTYPCY